MAGAFLHLEFDNLGIKAMIVEQVQNQTIITGDQHIHFKDLPESEEKIDPFDAAMDMIARQLDLTSIATAIILVSQRLVCFRTLELPFNSEKKVKQILPFELESLLPVINETYISDFHMLDTSGESNLILSASIAEAQVEKYFSKLGTFDIRPLMIAPAGYAAAVEFLNDHKNISSFIFLNFIDSENTLVIVNNSKPCAVRSFLPPLNSPEELATAVLQTIIGFNQRSGTDISFDVFISSDREDVNVENIYNVLEKTLGYPLELRTKIDSNTLLLNISPDKPIKYQFNFCKGKYGTSSFFKTYFTNIAAGAALIIFCLALLMMSISFDNARLAKRIKTIDDKALSIFMATFPDKKKIQDPYLQMKANTRAVIKKAGATGGSDQSINNKDLKIVGIIGELSKQIVSSIDIDISRFLFNKGRLVLSGSTDNFNNVNNIKSRIETSDLFEKVSISSAAADKKGDRVNFKFIIEM